MLLKRIAVFLVCSGIGVAIGIANDLRRNKQSMKIMNVVWILTGLWANYLALWAYNKFGKGKPILKIDGNDIPIEVKDNKIEANQSMDMPMDMDMNKGKDMKMDMPMDMDMSKGKDIKMDMPMDMDMSKGKDMKMDMPMDMGKKRPHWQSVALSALHCGAGCSLADIIGHWLSRRVFGFQVVWADWILDFCLALIIGVYFQFYAIREMEDISVGKGFAKAFKADVFSLTSWQVGMYGWMALVYFVFFKQFPLETSPWTFWFMMQIAMLFGFFCAYTMNALLIKLGIKKGM